MGRFYLGIGLLVVLLVLGLWVSAAMGDVHQQIADTLESAAQQVLAGQLEEGLRMAHRAKGQWQKSWHGTASVADHAPMDEIDSLFAQMEIYGGSGATVEFAACCNRVAQLVSAVGEAHGLSWWNLL